MTSILINHGGYHCAGPKKAVVQSSNKGEAPVLGIHDMQGTMLHTFKGGEFERTAQWSTGYAASVDFSGFQAKGRFRLGYKGPQGLVLSEAFDIDDLHLPSKLITDLLFYFKGQRCSGPWDEADRKAAFVEGRREAVDVHGGWYDASGDYSKYLSHLSYANYMNPQQTPLVVWNLSACRELAARAPGSRLPGLARRLDEEAAWGADFLVRMQDPEGYFYMTVFDRWSKDPKQREICSYSTMKGLKHTTWQAAWRQGGGLAIAALARVGGQNNQWGEYSPATYLARAAAGFAHLAVHGASYCDDGRENVIDDYCALLAASELALAAQQADLAMRTRCSLSDAEQYLEAARTRTESLKGRLMEGSTHSGWLRTDDTGERPFFHASDAGLPLIALLRYMEVEPDAHRRAEAARTARTLVEFDLALNREASNPFGLARQYVKSVDGSPRSAFFFPHRNESGYWWQGENARLASLAAAWLEVSRSELVRKAQPWMPVKAGATGAGLPQDAEAWTRMLEENAWNQVNWILGMNPFDMCMMHGVGRNNPDYLDMWPNAPGGVCNGITGGFDNEEDIAFKPGDLAFDPMNNWRWGEQWIPHGAWLLLALGQMAVARD